MKTASYFSSHGIQFDKKWGERLFPKYFENKDFIFQKKSISEVKKYAMLGQMTRVCSLAYDTYNKYVNWFP